MIEAIAAISGTQMGGASAVQSSQSVKNVPAMSFTEALKSTAVQQIETVQASEAMTMNAMHGKASLQDVVQSTVQAELAVETSLAIRNKMIEAYQEIMRMPI
ncbi:flagellar hook-basal body protein FliE [Parvularcula sp. ZS-1/3]|uniref:Flagellar hook-basal body complex protein FliE n=1 Tax=Parvularcula mediterranea TaxID=2732508 RepID=A0A7Y3RNM2_9PROT|nr:flagellar hook-basal body complex protein FliE [Parvularcula mediterranea]NNU17404.1 flagellar hook-basal body protein FliE [Parvularcula mediterranea]